MVENIKLVINCEICDTRNMKLEDYQQYDEIKIQGEFLIVSEESKSIINQLPVQADVERTIELNKSGNINYKIVNGSYEITGKSNVAENAMLIVNGPLTIAGDAKDSLKNYMMIIANGPTVYPQEMEGMLSNVIVNGPSDAYPDGATVLDRKFVMDQYFPLRARENSIYYASNEVIVKDSKVDLGKLVAKNTRFYTKKAVMPEEVVEQGACLFDEKTAFIVVPANMKLLYQNVELTASLLEKEGKDLYIYGNLEIPKDTDISLLKDKIGKIIVTGKVFIYRNHEECFYDLDIEYDTLEIKKGKSFNNTAKVVIDQFLMEHQPEGIKVVNVLNVHIAPEITADVILEKMRFVNCAEIYCTRQQESAVAAVSINVRHIGEERNKENEDHCNDARFINAEYHIM